MSAVFPLVLTVGWFDGVWLPGLVEIVGVGLLMPGLVCH